MTSSKPQNNKKILVIDDSPTLRKIVTFYLSKEGFDVSEAVNGKKGLNLIKEHLYDLIILDMNMPIMNGFEVLKVLKEDKNFSVPILILSADKEEESKAESIVLGASYYMTKPFKPYEVVSKINEIFQENIDKNPI